MTQFLSAGDAFVWTVDQDPSATKLDDAFLAAVAEGMRLYHDKHGVTLKELRVTMPINLRTAADPVGGNRATLLRFDLPTDIRNTADRIRGIHERTTAARQEKSLRYTPALAGAMNLAPFWYVSSMLRAVDFIASDVPGLSTPRLFAGAPVRGQYAFAPTLGAAFNITLLSFVAGFDDVLASAD